MRRFLVVAAALLVIGLVAGLVLDARRRDPSPEGDPEVPAARTRSREEAANRRTPEPEPEASAGAEGATPGVDLLAGLRAALEAGDAEAVRAAARELRKRLRTDAASWDAAVALLRSDSEPSALRAALAVVLGTIETPRTDAVLIAALSEAGSDPALQRAIVIGLGATREPPDDDEIFDLSRQPWGEEGPAGLGVTVRRNIDDGATRSALIGVLRAEAPETRRIAAAALRHSLGAPDVVAAFRDTLREERADAPLSEVAEALAVRARSVPEQESGEFLRDLVRRATETGLDATRFRVIDDLHRVPQPPDVTSRLQEIAFGEHEFAVRLFALDLLAAGAASQDGRSVEPARETLSRVLELSADDALRDNAARLLRTLPANERSQQVLVRAVAEDRAWNVRYTALESLAALHSPALASALEAANRDGDERVRALAAELSEQR